MTPGERPSTVEEHIWASGNRVVHEAALNGVADYHVWMLVYNHVDTMVWRTGTVLDEAVWAVLRREFFT